MYEGWANFAGEEIFNADRLAAYINAGLFPDGAIINACDECGTLARGLGQQEYRSPVLDQASWVDTLNPDTYEFAGVMPLEITGLNGSTRTAEVVEFAGDGGVVRKPRYGTRTVAVTALLVGKTTASVEAGLTWLSTVLSGGSGCAPGCLGDDLCFLSYCPDLDEIEDMTQGPTPTPIPWVLFDAYDGKYQDGGVFIPYLERPLPQVVSATNLATNPGLESGSQSGWATVSTPDYPATLDTTAPIAGVRSVMTTRGNTPPTTTASGLALTGLASGAAYMPLAAGTTVTISCDVKPEKAERRIRLYLQYYNGTSTIQDTVLLAVQSTEAGQVYRVSATGVIPPTMNSVRLRLLVEPLAGTAVTGERVWYDRCRVSTGTGTAAIDPTYFDGSSPALAGHTYAWTGAVNASTSLQYSAQQVLTNRMIAPLGPTSTDVQAWESQLGSAPISPVAGGGAQITFPAALDASLLAAPISPIPAGGIPQLTVAADIAMSFAGRHTLQIMWVTAAGVPIDFSNNVSVSVAAGTWAHQVVTGTPPPTAAGFVVRVQTPDAITPNGTLAVRQVTAQVGSLITGGFFDGDTADNATYTFDWTGTPGASSSTRSVIQHGYNPRLVLTTPIPCYTDAQFGITVNSVSGPVSWHLDFTDKATGELLHRSATRTSSNTLSYKLAIPSDWSDWIVTVYPHDFKPLSISNIYVSHRPVSNPRSCFDDATITYGNSVCVSGPTVTDKMGFACGETLYKVEWTWVSGNPFAQGRTTGLVTNMNLTTGVAARKAYEVVTRNPRDVAYTSTVCKPKIDTYRPGLSDPCCSGWVLPPSAPALVDDCFDPPTTFARTEMWIPPRYAPGNGWGALTITLTNDSRMKRGLRMRVYPDPLGRGIDFLGAVTPSKQECQFCEEWWFTYISPDSDTVIDGVHSRIYTRKTGYQDINSAANVRGRNGGPFGFPTIDCNAGYLIVVDMPKTYPFDCGQYDKGDSQGSAVLDVAITTMGL